MLGEGQDTRHRRWEPTRLGMAILSFSTSLVDALKMFKMLSHLQWRGWGSRRGTENTAHFRGAEGDPEEGSRPVHMKVNSLGATSS